jgi:hypothetical protein
MMATLDRSTLKTAEAMFLQRFPGGFDDPEMQVIAKRHRMDRMITFAQESFSLSALEDVNKSADNMVKIVSRSSMVSMFEKPKFRDFVGCLSAADREFLVRSLGQLLHGDQQSGFEALVDLMQTEKLAKWSLVSIIPTYFSPNTEVFVKPTTAKNIIAHFEVPDLVYRPLPSWHFYTAYRELINQSKKLVDPGLSPTNAGFSGFLMMAMG